MLRGGRPRDDRDAAGADNTTTNNNSNKHHNNHDNHHSNNNSNHNDNDDSNDDDKTYTIQALHFTYTIEVPHSIHILYSTSTTCYLLSVQHHTIQHHTIYIHYTSNRRKKKKKK